GWLAGQYDNPANPGAHLTTTGPEIWDQTAGKVTHFVAGIGTGGTISGAGTFLRDTGAVTIVGADPENSVYGGGDGSPYYVESIGHYVHPATETDVWPRSYDPKVIDRIERVTDRDSIAMTRRLAREEGILVGASTGTAVVAALRVARGLGPEALAHELTRRHKVAFLARLIEVAQEVGARDPEALGEQLALLYDGASSRSVVFNSPTPGNRAREIAALLIDAQLQR
ncbi:pyridoxal-phosphate dependent enzyme, partial [Winogradskya humida]|uniref:pyridoxal-phosphate dependent enzyme n=1 Tax=Winogradskya humida TaxID=113566 RepID=UPI001EF1BF6F